MSFTMDIKEEISSHEYPVLENIAELSGFIRSNYRYSLDKIELVTENKVVATRILNLIEEVYGTSGSLVDKQLGNFNSKRIYVIEITNKVKTILKDLSLIDEKDNFIESPKEYITGSIEEEKAYIRGSFLAKGSISDPANQYHLEIVFDNKYEAVFVQRLLNEFDLNCKIIIRDTKYMVYIKEAEKISDFLKVIGAAKSVLYFEDTRITKEYKNKTNRLNNCEQANMDKIIMTADNQIKQINYIDEVMGLDLLDEKLQETCNYRIKYPEASLDELSKIITLETNNKVTKSGLNHRFRKIKEIYERLLNNKSD